TWRGTPQLQRPRPAKHSGSVPHYLRLNLKVHRLSVSGNRFVQVKDGAGDDRHRRKLCVVYAFSQARFTDAEHFSCWGGVGAKRPHAFLIQTGQDTSLGSSWRTTECPQERPVKLLV